MTAPDPSDEVARPSDDPRSVGEFIVCGDDHPNPVTNDLAKMLRANEGYPTEGGCGRRMRWTYAYRCVECGRWFHRDCIKEHFAATGDDVTAGATREGATA